MPATEAMGETGGAQQDQSAGRAELHGFNFLKRLSLGSKLTVGFAILVTLTLIVVALNYAGSINAVRNINRTSDLRAPSALASARAQANLLRMLSEVRGYLALGDEVFKDNYEAASQAFQADLAELEKLLGTSVSGGPPQASKRRLDEFKVALADWQDLPQRLFREVALELRKCSTGERE